ncbi:MAG: hypothetical protein KC646_04110 [Candidatus Cloacimonetes bacterium]|nr:hypothetical protein [Candidatus Cloacimonadota bacterium]
MKILVPIKVEKFDETYSGSLSFDPDFVVSDTSKDLVLNQLYEKVAPSIQINKDSELIDDLTKLKDLDSDFMQVDFFSRGEHRVMMFLLIVCLFILYVPAASVFTFLWSVFYSPISTELFSLDVMTIFSTDMVTLGFVRIIIFIFIWNITYNYLYPRFIDIYSSLILGNTTVFTFHRLFIARLAFLKSDDYDLKARLR